MNPEDQQREAKTREMINRAIQLHEHDGSLSKQIQFQDLFGVVRTIDVAGDLTNALAETPREFYEQILIDTTTADKKMYVYDMVGGTWYYILLDPPIFPDGLTGTKVYYVSDTSGGLVTRKLTFTDGILTAET